jgi:putative alpha-1,2-mannosidase
MANEPDFVTPYAYLFAGQPWKTQEVVTRIEQQTFNTKPNGIPGNDDLGAISGVYVWNALGLYPGIPGVGGLLIGTPMFPSAAIHMADGRTPSIRATGTGPYVQQVLFDGRRTRIPGCRCPHLARAPQSSNSRSARNRTSSEASQTPNDRSHG